MKKSWIAVVSLLLLGIVCPFDAIHAGVVVRLLYDNTGIGGSVNDLRNSPSFPNSPTRKDVLTTLASPADFAGGEAYGTYVRGYIEAPMTGLFKFYIRSDDGSELWLGTDHTPDGIRLVAQEPTCCAGFVDDGVHSSEPIALERGRKYYFEVLHKEGTQGDYFYVGWQLPNGTFEGAISGKYLMPFPINPDTNQPRQTGPIIINGVYNNGAVMGQPAGTNVAEGQTVTLTVSVEASQPAGFQWRHNGQPIPGAILSHYTIPVVSAADYGDYDVIITNSIASVTSDKAVLQGAADLPALTVASVATLGNFNAVDVTFSKPVSAASGANKANYSINNGAIPISKAELISDRIVRLTAPLPEGTTYTLTVQNVQDRSAAPPLTVAPNPSTASFLQVQGKITRRVFKEIGGGPGLNDLYASAKFSSNAPDVVDYPNVLETPVDVAEYYGVQFQGFVTAPVTGAYTFYIASDDEGIAYLSTDENPDNKVQVAYTATARRTRDYLAGQTINLVAGKKYYIEALMKEAGGNDNLAIAWKKPGDRDVVMNDPPIGKEYLSAFASNGAVTITNQPQGRSVAVLDPVTLRVGVDGVPPYMFQWLRNGAPIDGASKTELKIPAVSPLDNGSDYSVVVRNAFSSVTSAVARVTLVSENSFRLTRAAGNETRDKVILSFSKPVFADTAIDPANYAINHLDTGGPLSISDAQVSEDGYLVTLTTGAQSKDSSYLVTVTNLTEAAPANTPLPSDSQMIFTSWKVVPGPLRIEYYTVIAGIVVADLTNHPKFPGSPDLVDSLNSFSSPSGWGENYGARMSGYFIPDVTEDFIFYLRSDDASQLFLSTDDDPANKRVIAREDGCCHAYGEPTIPALTSTPIHLEAGKPYYIEALLKEGASADYVSAVWKPASDPTAPVTLQAPFGNILGVLADPRTPIIKIMEQPADASREEGQTAVFTVRAVASTFAVSYQWQVDEVDIPGATNATYTTPALTLGDDGKKFDCVISIEGATETSIQALLTVTRRVTSPPLTIRRSANNVELSWPSEALGFTLQVATRLAPSADWQNISGTSSVTNKTETVTSGNRFYRLVR